MSSSVSMHFQRAQHKPLPAYISLLQTVNLNIPVSSSRRPLASPGSCTPAEALQLSKIRDATVNTAPRKRPRSEGSSFIQRHQDQALPSQRNSFFVFISSILMPIIRAENGDKGSIRTATHIPFRFWASDGGFSERRVLVSQSIGPSTPPRSTMRSSSMTPTTQWPSRRPILHDTQRS